MILNHSQESFLIYTQSTINRYRIQEINDYGLYTGKTGLCISLFELGHHTGIQAFKDDAVEMLNEVSSNIAEVEGLGLASGLAGVGWAIELIVQSGQLKEDTNVLLEEVDDELYRDMVFSKSSDISIAYGTLGKALYFLKRLKSLGSKKSRFRKICTIECLVLAGDEVCDSLESQMDRDSFKQDELRLLIQAYFFIVKLKELRINFQRSETILERLSHFLQTIVRDTTENTDLFTFSYIYAFNNSLAESKKIGDELMNAWRNNQKDYGTIVDNSRNFKLLREIRKVYGRNLNWEEAWYQTTVDFAE